MKLAAALLFAFMLAACGTTDHIYKPSDRPAPVPEGYKHLCIEFPNYPTCKPTAI